MNQNISLFLLWKMYILVGIFFMSGAVALAQNENIVLQLIDEDTEMPVSFAHYTIGAEKGVSDAEGKISIAINPDDELQLSHVLYGNLYFKAEELSKLKSNGRLKLKQLEITLQPAVVMGVHTQKYPDEQLEINYQDLLSHDAGAFLEKSPAISSIKKSGSYGFDPVFRGFKYDQLNIVIDGGQSATAACPNRMDPPASQISLNMMDRVEVLKGPILYAMETRLVAPLILYRPIRNLLKPLLLLAGHLLITKAMEVFSARKARWALEINGRM
jgi:iron complex outermembrane receptor protein